MPTRRAAVLLVIVALAVVLLPVPPVLALIVSGGIIGCTVTDMVVARRHRPVSERSDVPTLARGSPIPFSLRVTTPGGRVVRLRQPLPPGLGVAPTETGADSVVGTICGRHRGQHVLPPAVVRTHGPLGLGACDHVVGTPRPVTVLPDLPAARRQAIARRRGRSSDEGRLRTRLGLGTEFESIRDYVPDDDIRQLNWMASARTGRPMSNQFRVEENRDLVCAVDAGRLMAAPVGAITRLDASLDAVAATAVAADEAGDRVGTIAFAGTVLRTLRPRRRGAETVVRALFDLEPVEAESDFELAFEAVGGWKRALVVIFTDVMDEFSARTLLGAVQMLVRRHAVLVATCVDSDVTSAILKEPDDPHDVLRASVASDLLASRQRVTGMLRSMGAVVVEAEPDKLGAACVAGYLNLKRRARL